LCAAKGERRWMQSVAVPQAVPKISAAPMMAVTNRHWRRLARLLSRRTQLYTEMLVDKAIILGEPSRALSLLQGFPGELSVAGEEGLCRPGSPGWESRAAAEAEVARLLQAEADALRQVGGEDGAAAPAWGEAESGGTVVQLGGGVAEEMAAAARYCVAAGYSTINVNCGCPSPKLQRHESKRSRFGAVLMLEPDRVEEILLAMAQAVTVEGVQLANITVKCRVGIDNDNDYGFLTRFVAACQRGGAKHMVIHARNAVLSAKLSPKANLSVPPLRYEAAYALIKDFPEITFGINGGVGTLAEAQEHLRQGAASVMLGRAARDRLWMLSEVDSTIFGDAPGALSRTTVALQFARYAEADFNASKKTWPQREKPIVQPLMSLFHDTQGSSSFRSALEEALRMGPSGQRRRSREGIIATRSRARQAIQRALDAYSVKAAGVRR